MRREKTDLEWKRIRRRTGGGKEKEKKMNFQIYFSPPPLHPSPSPSVTPGVYPRVSKGFVDNKLKKIILYHD